MEMQHQNEIFLCVICKGIDKKISLACTSVNPLLKNYEHLAFYAKLSKYGTGGL